MKRGGIALAVLLAISGVLRVAGPGSSSGSQTTGPASGAASKPASAPASESTYERKLYGTIQDFFGDWPGASAPGLDAHLAVPDCSRSEIEVVIAILPDPVHTRLGLFFDRDVEALQQAAQKQHYAFDRAILPWDRNPHSALGDLKAHEETTAEQDARESFPGLVIFRDGFSSSGELRPEQGSPSPNTADCYLHHKPLFVFIVGETPTGGVRKKQFRNALQILRKIRGPQAAASGAQNSSLLRILGPSFSGSLDSLATLLHEDANTHSEKDPFAPIVVYSGTVTGRSAMERFNSEIATAQGHFASFLENDDFSLAQFVLFAHTEGFEPNEIAVLSEDETEYGAPREDAQSEPADSGVIHLHFPREISYFRSAYQKEIAAQQQQASSSAQAPPRSTLPLDLNETGNDDDSVSPYDVALTTLSQESALLGVISELQKHHIKFTILLATNPSDQLFLARYLRTAYPQGRVVVTAPDLLLSREDDTLLHGVLGLNTYPLLPGLDDALGHYGQPSSPSESRPHEDRLFVSSLSVGEFNAMVGLLALTQRTPGATAEKSTKMQSLFNRGFIPAAPYAEYAPPAVQYQARADARKEAPHRPLLWLTILGRDGYWPIVALSPERLVSTDGFEPVVSLSPKKDGPVIPTTLHESLGQLLSHRQRPSPKPQEVAQSQSRSDDSADTPPVWNLALCICLLVLSLHAILSWKGTALADSETRAQFARDAKDCRAALIIAIGAFALCFAFALILLTRSVRVAWDGGPLFTLFLWLLYATFVGVTFRDLSSWRGQPRVANVFLISVGLMTAFQLVLWTAPENWTLVYWSNRMIHFDSGLSPALPVLLLLAGGYWWMWMSLRAVALVDLRRPRLPEQEDLADQEANDLTRPKSPYAPDLNSVSHRIGDEEGEQLREVAHPFYVKWQVLLPVIGLFLIALTVLDLKHPIQTIEGRAYDWGYTVLLCVLVGTFLGSLLKLVLSWLKCRQILAGLDRLPLRDAFGRMKDLSWHSFWNPGGSTLRETYKIMSRTLQNLQRLRPLLDVKPQALSRDCRKYAADQIDEVFKKREVALEKYRKLFANKSPALEAANKTKGGVGAFLRSCFAWFNGFFVAEQNRASKEQALMSTVEDLQRQIAKAAAVVMRYVLAPFWMEEESPVVSEGKDLMDHPKLTPVRSLAEEFVALVYVNFLISVLLRLRAFVVCAIGMYVCIVVSISVYPFEPHPALQALVVILLIVGGAATGYVYAEMHREPILSKLTSTSPGELGWDFWLKLVSAGAIPIFSLLAGQFPGLNKLLFSWLQPALNAVK